MLPGTSLEAQTKQTQLPGRGREAGVLQEQLGGDRAWEGTGEMLSPALAVLPPDSCNQHQETARDTHSAIEICPFLPHPGDSSELVARRDRVRVQPEAEEQEMPCQERSRGCCCCLQG